MQYEYERWKKSAVGRRDYNQTLRFLLHNLNDLDFTNILEIGCGIGKLCDALHDMRYQNITGVDISSSAIAFGRNRFAHLNLHCMDAMSLTFPSESFDRYLQH